MDSNFIKLVLKKTLTYRTCFSIQANRQNKEYKNDKKALSFNNKKDKNFKPSVGNKVK